jgi:hypothetical protein
MSMAWPLAVDVVIEYNQTTGSDAYAALKEERDHA